MSWNRRRTPKGTIGTTNQTLRWTMGVIGPRINPFMRQQTHKQTYPHKQTGQITIHCAAKLSAQCNKTFYSVHLKLKRHYPDDDEQTRITNSWDWRPTVSVQYIDSTTPLTCISRCCCPPGSCMWEVWIDPREHYVSARWLRYQTWSGAVVTGVSGRIDRFTCDLTSFVTRD